MGPTDTSSVWLVRRRASCGTRGKSRCPQSSVWLLTVPRKVAVMKSSGKFVVCDRGNERSRMQIFTKHGHFVRWDQAQPARTTLTSILQENCNPLHRHRGRLGHNEGGKYRWDFTRTANTGLTQLSRSGCGLCDPDHLRDPGARGAPPLVWLCRLHEGAQWHRRGWDRLLCLWLQGGHSRAPD